MLPFCFSRPLSQGHATPVTVVPGVVAPFVHELNPQVVQVPPCSAFWVRVQVFVGVQELSHAAVQEGLFQDPMQSMGVYSQ
jgi:hypothetical protein